MNDHRGWRDSLPQLTSHPDYIRTVADLMESRPKCEGCLNDPDGYGRCDECVEFAHLHLLGQIECGEMFEVGRGHLLKWLAQSYADTLPYERKAT